MQTVPERRRFWVPVALGSQLVRSRWGWAPTSSPPYWSRAWRTHQIHDFDAQDEKGQGPGSTPALPTAGNDHHFFPKDSRFLHPTSQRREEGPGGRGDHATGSWARVSRPSQPRREARGRGVRNTHTAHRSPACSLRPTDPGAATPRPTSSPGPQRSGVAGRSAAGPETSPGRGHACRAEGGGGAVTCSDGVLEFRSRGLFHFYTNIATFSYFSGEANGPAAPPSRATLTVGDTCVWFTLVSAFAPCPAALSPGVWAHGVSSVLNKHDTFLHTAGSGPRQRHPGSLGTRHSPFLKLPARKTDPHILCGSFFFFL